MAADTQADLAVDFEAAGWGQEAEAGWTVGVGWGEDDAAVVDAVCVGGGGGTGDGEMPFEEIGFEGGGVEGRIRRREEFLGLA